MANAEVADKFKAAFKSVDSQNVGHLSDAQVKYVLKRLGSWSDSDIKSLLDGADRNKDEPDPRRSPSPQAGLEHCCFL